MSRQENQVRDVGSLQSVELILTDCVKLSRNSQLRKSREFTCRSERWEMPEVQNRMLSAADTARKNMFEREDTTYNNLRKNSFYGWLDELEQNEDISVRGGVKLAKEYVAHLEDEIAKLKESNELKKEYLKKAVSRHDK